jgi:dienelactone hydrolase
MGHHTLGFLLGHSSCIVGANQYGVMGWSTGGYCAALLHLREPARFGAAASIEGYFTPAPGGGTGNLAQLLKMNPTLAHESSPM